MFAGIQLDDTQKELLNFLYILHNLKEANAEELIDLRSLITGAEGFTTSKDIIPELVKMEASVKAALIKSGNYTSIFINKGTGRLAISRNNKKPKAKSANPASPAAQVDAFYKLVKKYFDEDKTVRLTSQDGGQIGGDPITLTELKSFYDKFYLDIIPSSMYIDQIVGSKIHRFYNSKILLSKNPDIKIGDDGLIEELFIRSDANLASEILADNFKFTEEQKSSSQFLDNYFKTINSLNLTQTQRIKLVLKHFELEKTTSGPVNVSKAIGGLATVGAGVVSVGHGLIVWGGVTYILGGGLSFLTDKDNQLNKLEKYLNSRKVDTMIKVKKPFKITQKGNTEEFNNELKKYNLPTVLITDIVNKLIKLTAIPYYFNYKIKNYYKMIRMDKGVKNLPIRAILKLDVLEYKGKFEENHVIDKGLWKKDKNLKELGDGTIESFLTKIINGPNNYESVKTKKKDGRERGVNPLEYLHMIANKHIRNLDNIITYGFTIGDYIEQRNNLADEPAKKQSVKKIDFIICSLLYLYINQKMNITYNYFGDNDIRELDKINNFKGLHASLDILQCLFRSFETCETPGKDITVIFDYLSEETKIDTTNSKDTDTFLSDNLTSVLGSDVNHKIVFNCMNKYYTKNLEAIENIRNIPEDEEEQLKQGLKSVIHTEDLTTNVTNYSSGRYIKRVVNTIISEIKGHSHLFFNDNIKSEVITDYSSSINQDLVNKTYTDVLNDDEKVLAELITIFKHLKNNGTISKETIDSINSFINDNLKSFGGLAVEDESAESKSDKSEWAAFTRFLSTGEGSMSPETANLITPKIIMSRTYGNRKTQLKCEIEKLVNPILNQILNNIKSNSSENVDSEKGSMIRKLFNNIKSNSSENVDSEKGEMIQKLFYMADIINDIKCAIDIQLVTTEDDFFHNNNRIINKLCNMKNKDIFFGKIMPTYMDELNTSKTELSKLLISENSTYKTETVYIRSEIDLNDTNYKEIYGKKSAIADTAIEIKNKFMDLVGSTSNPNKGSFEKQLKGISGITFTYLEYYSLLATHVGLENEFGILGTDHGSDAGNWLQNSDKKIRFIEVRRMARQVLDDENDSELKGEFRTQLEKIKLSDSDGDKDLLEKILNFVLSLPGRVWQAFIVFVRATFNNLVSFGFFPAAVIGKLLLVLTPLGVVEFVGTAVSAVGAVAVTVTPAAIAAAALGLITLLGVLALPLIFRSLFSLIRSLLGKTGRDLSVAQNFMNSYFSSASNLQEPIKIIRDHKISQDQEITVEQLMKSILNSGNRVYNIIDFLTDLSLTGIGNENFQCSVVISKKNQFGILKSAKKLNETIFKEPEIQQKIKQIKQKVKVIDILPDQIKYAMADQASSYDEETGKDLKDYDKNRIATLARIKKRGS